MDKILRTMHQESSNLLEYDGAIWPLCINRLFDEEDVERGPVIKRRRLLF